MIHLDTSVLIESPCGRRLVWPQLHRWTSTPAPIGISALVLHEFRRGPRLAEEIRLQQRVFPDHRALAFGPAEAILAAEFYRALPRARYREYDFAIAACAITHSASLWTLNTVDFADIPGLQLFRPDVA